MNAVTTKADILSIFAGKHLDQITITLQQIFLNPPEGFDGELLEQIGSFREHRDIGTRFWAKKVWAKYSPKYQLAINDLIDPITDDSLSLEILSKMLQDFRQSTFQSMRILQKIVELRTPAALAILLQFLKTSTDPFQISFLTKHLGINFPTDELLTVLCPYLSHRDDRIVANTIEGIEAVGSTRSFEICAKLLSHRSNRVRANAAKAVSRYDAKRAGEILLRMLAARTQPHLVVSACHVIREIKGDQYIAALLELLNEDLIIDESLKALAVFPPDRIAPMLSSFAARLDERRTKVLSTLANLPGTSVWSKLNLPAIPTISKFSQWPGFPQEWSKKIPSFDEFNAVYGRPIGISLAVVLLVFIFWQLPSLTLKENPVAKQSRDALSKLHLPFNEDEFLRAIVTDNISAFDLFIKAGMNVNLRNRDGGTPLHVSAVFDRPVFVDRLLGADGRVSAQDSRGLTPLHLAKSKAIIEKLLAKGADPDARDLRGRTPLHCLAESGKEDAIEFLLQKGAKVNIQAADGDTPLHVALRAGKSKIAGLLVKYGANASLRNRANHSAYDLGLERPHGS
ncbi:MAG: ankyrin repeat domain-containing protein [Candidatus Ozemobacteraceae bacterium]